MCCHHRFLVIVLHLLYDRACTWTLNNEFLDSIGPQRIHSYRDPNHYLLDCTQDYFTNQLVDHFNSSDNRTWPQRYFYGQNCFEDGGPLILEIGGEWEIKCLNSPARKIACALKGLYIYIEHRFYGTSFPFKPYKTGDREPASVDELEYLSSKQAIADIARLRKHVNTENKQTFVVGCSYGGTLAFWARQLHPDVIDAAIAMSPPLLAQLDFRNYWKLSAQTLNKVSKSKCGDYLMSRGFENELYSLFDIKMFDPSSMRDFERKTGLCTNSMAGMCMADKIVHYLVKEYGEQVYSYAQTAHAKSTSINSTCNSKTNIEKDVQKFLHQRFPTLLRSDKTCIDAQVFHDYVFSYNKIRQKEFEAKRERLENWAWFWQKCTEFGWMKPDAAENIESYTNRICRKYNIGYNRVKRNIQATNDYFKLEKRKDGYTLLVNGEHDPWRDLSKTAKVEKHIVVNVSHCPDNAETVDAVISKLKSWFFWLNDWTDGVVSAKIKTTKSKDSYDIYANDSSKQVQNKS